MDAGGAETFLMKLYRNMDRKQYQMDFAVNVQKKAFYDDEILVMGGKLYYIPPKTRDLKGFKDSLYRLIKEENYQYVLRITSSCVGFYDLKIAKKAGAKVCAARSSNSSDGGGLVINILNKVSRLLFLRYVDVMIAPSDLAAEYTFGKNQVKKGKVHFLKNAIDLDLFTYSEAARQEIRKEFQLNDEFLLGHIGRFSEQKNHKFMIDIFARVHEEIPQARLLLAGEGELCEEIKGYVTSKALQEYVIFAGVRKDVAKLLSAMDLFLLPSLYEGMPNVVIEAQATGLPCLIADTITREADLTGLVKYFPLDNVNLWCDNVKRELMSNKERLGQAEMLRASGYDVREEVHKFTRYMTKTKE